MRAFAEGALAGLGIAVPVGAIAVLIVDLAMRQGFARAVPAALGAASADLLYAVVAVLAGTAVASALEPHQRTIQLVSAGVLAAILVYRTWRLLRPVDLERPRRTAEGPLRIYGSFLALTLVNPMTVTYFAALILGLGPDTLGSGTDKTLFAAGAGIASASWQLLLAGTGAILHHRLSEGARVATALFGNLLIAAFAVRLALGN
jgi:threonine/homoserine/homoserine lactone efflux protein